MRCTHISRLKEYEVHNIIKKILRRSYSWAFLRGQHILSLTATAQPAIKVIQYRKKANDTLRSSSRNSFHRVTILGEEVIFFRSHLTQSCVMVAFRYDLKSGKVLTQISLWGRIEVSAIMMYPKNSGSVGLGV